MRAMCDVLNYSNIYIACTMHDNLCMRCAMCSTILIYIHFACTMHDNLCVRCAMCSTILIYIYCVHDARLCMHAICDVLNDSDMHKQMYILCVRCTIIYACDVRCAQRFCCVYIHIHIYIYVCILCARYTIIYVCDVLNEYHKYIVCTMHDNICLRCAMCSTKTIHILHV